MSNRNKQPKTNDMTKFSTPLKDTKERDLVQFNSRSDIYMVLENDGYLIRLRNMYSEKESLMRHYTTKGGETHLRKVEVVDFY